jgi:hypothetical protein
LHQILTDIGAIISGLGLLVTAISSLYNGAKIRQHEKSQKEMHAVNSERLDYIAKRVNGQPC